MFQFGNASVRRHAKKILGRMTLFDLHLARYGQTSKRGGQGAQTKRRTNMHHLRTYSQAAILLGAAIFSGSAGAQEQARPAVPRLHKIWSFGGGADGAQPSGGVVADGSGALYGVAADGAFGQGIVFQLTPPSAPGGAWTENVLYNFQGGADGYGPSNGVVFGNSGELYGVTTAGGINGDSCSEGCGTVFELTPPAVAGGAWTHTVLYSFTGGADGGTPEASPLLFHNGALYGATFSGGIAEGTFFELAPPISPGGAWTETVIYALPGDGDGSPGPSVTFGSDGNLYGSSAYGNIYQCIPPAAPGGSWTINLIYSFPTRGAPCCTAMALTGGAGGELYGVYDPRGAEQHGQAFELTPPAVAGGAWTYTTLHKFRGGRDGAEPMAGMLLYNGSLYGTTVNGGVGCAKSGCGTLFKVSPPSAPGGPWKESILYRFTGKTGKYPASIPLVNKGALYGTAPIGGTSGQGTAFWLMP
jgi:uncharacterized repeat protein (TIGR03803 family)